MVGPSGDSYFFRELVYCGSAMALERVLVTIMRSSLGPGFNCSVQGSAKGAQARRPRDWPFKKTSQAYLTIPRSRAAGRFAQGAGQSKCRRYSPSPEKYSPKVERQSPSSIGTKAVCSGSIYSKSCSPAMICRDGRMVQGLSRGRRSSFEIMWGSWAVAVGPNRKTNDSNGAKTASTATPSEFWDALTR